MTRSGRATLLPTPLPAVLLAVAGGLLAFWALGRGWLTVTTPRPGPLPSEVTSRSGRDAVPWAVAVSAVAVAGGVALLATRAVGRAVVAATLVCAGAGLVAAALVGVESGERSADVAPLWPSLTAAGGAMVAAAGVLGLLRGRRWAAMARRYGPPVDRAEPGDDPAVAWDALDRGDDPTAG